ncbi:MAG: response regulator transcription factor [Caldilineaceae bacterium]
MPGYLLLVDDDQLLRRSLAFNLQQAGYIVQSAADAERALGMVRADPPDLILLDIGLPSMDGLEALRQLRDQVPVIFVSARQRHFDEILGLELGAEDYVTKPFDFEVLLARIRTVLRRTRRQPQTATQPGALQVGDLTIEPASYDVTCVGRVLHLPPREFRLLYTLALSAGQVVSTEQLIEKVWGPTYAGEPQILYVHIRSLREKLEADPQHPQRILTVRSVGYKLAPQGITPES